MSPTTLCIIAFVISVVFFVGAIALGLYRHYSNLKSYKSDTKTSILSPLQIVIIGFFLALITIFYPVYHFSYFAGEGGILKVLKSVLLSIQNSLQVFLFNTDFNQIKEFLSGSANIDKHLAEVYSVYAIVMYVLAPAMIASFVISLFKETSARLRYALIIGADIYILSSLNEKSITLATDIKNKAQGRKLIVFAGVQKKNADEGSTLLAQAKRLGAICFKSDITGINLKRKTKNIRRKLYFISDKEDDNISKSLDVIQYCLKEKNKNLNNEKTELYIFAHSVESEILLNSADIGKMKVRRVNDNKNLAWQTLRENSIFEDAKLLHPEREEGQLNIVIVGCGNYGKELLKGICWLGQMPKHSLCVHVFDKDKDIKGKIRYIAPELIERSGKEEKGESSYSISFYPETDVTSSAFLDKLKAIGDITSVFVTLGSDELNIDTAIRMRIELLRNGYKDSSPSIYPVVYSSILSDIAHRGKKLVISGKDKSGKDKEMSYNLKFIGAIDNRYSLKNTEQEDLEKKAQIYHLVWADRNDPNQIKENIAKFNKYEYYRASSMAQAIYNEYLVKQIKSFKTEGSEFTKDDIILFNEYEHRRWNAYMRAEGYSYADERDDLAKRHKDLRSFDRLSPKDKEKDNVWQIALQLEGSAE